MKAKTVALAALIAMALSITPAQSANKKAPAAKQKSQPLTAAPSRELAGVSLGQPISIDECPSEVAIRDYRIYKSEYQIPAANKPCWQHSYTSKPTMPLPQSGKISVIPAVSFPGVKDINVKLIDGSAEEVTLITYGEGVQDKLYASLSQKYGTPKSKDVVKEQNRMGAEFGNIVAEWKFTDLTVSFSGIVGRVDTGIVSASTPRADNARVVEKQEREKSEPKL